jgi:hypothetical protein
MGEKFAANPVTGTGSMTVPIATSPGRSGFGPQLSLSYDSGSSNGPFGFGWSLTIPSITRKTDKGLPRYFDGDESDVFILSGAEDLVPVLHDDDCRWTQARTVGGTVYTIQRYRSRVEGLFARIECWTNQAETKDTFWRSISKENITTWYGKTKESRIINPGDSTQIFSWLIYESYDDKGNAIVYHCKPENPDRIFENERVKPGTKIHERNRDHTSRSAQRYQKRIRYGNHISYLWALKDYSPWPQPPGDDHWFFEVVFDYGEHDGYVPQSSDDPGRSYSLSWPTRTDPFSSYRAGFEVRSTDFTYSYEQNPSDARDPIYSFLLSVVQSSYKRQGSGYLKHSLPPLEFEDTQPIVQETIAYVSAESLENLPAGLDCAIYQWTDLHGEGIPVEEEHTHVLDQAFYGVARSGTV